MGKRLGSFPFNLVIIIWTMNEQIENETTTEEIVVTNQLGEETSIAPTSVEFNPDEYQQLLAKGAELRNRTRSVSIVPKYYEFKMSVMVTFFRIFFLNCLITPF